MDLRSRQNNKHDPAVQEYLEWLSFHWAEHFAELQNSERQQPSSSSSSWSPSPTLEFVILGPKLAKMALIWMARRKVVRQKVRKTKLDPRSKKACGNDIEWRGRKRSGMEVLLTLKKDNGIVQPTKWRSNSKRLVSLYSKVSVSVVES